MLTMVALAAGAALVAGCGGGARQDANESHGTFTVKVTRASFPAHQAVARQTQMVLKVRNTSTATIPNIAVTLDSLYYTSNFPNLASNKRPIWVVETGPGAVPKKPVESEAVAPPGSGQTAYVETWALGKLAPGATQTFRWLLAPVKPGTYNVHYVFAAGLAGRARARLASGGLPGGTFTATIAPRPPAKFVNPNTGKVVPGIYPPGT
jgi:hypothetical protein